LGHIASVSKTKVQVVQAPFFSLQATQKNKEGEFTAGSDEAT
jgi:hypothetical protein